MVGAQKKGHTAIMGGGSVTASTPTHTPFPPSGQQRRGTGLCSPVVECLQGMHEVCSLAVHTQKED